MEGARSPALSVLLSAGILAVCEETVMAAREHRDHKDGFFFVLFVFFRGDSLCLRLRRSKYSVYSVVADLNSHKKD